MAFCRKILENGRSYLQFLSVGYIIVTCVSEYDIIGVSERKMMMMNEIHDGMGKWTNTQ